MPKFYGKNRQKLNNQSYANYTKGCSFIYKTKQTKLLSFIKFPNMGRIMIQPTFDNVQPVKTKISLRFHAI